MEPALFQEHQASPSDWAAHARAVTVSISPAVNVKGDIKLEYENVFKLLKYEDPSLCQ